MILFVLFQLFSSVLFQSSKRITLESIVLLSQPTLSKSGLSSNLFTYPRQSYAIGLTWLGIPNILRNSSIDSMLTQPTPIPSALAANHRF